MNISNKIISFLPFVETLRQYDAEKAKADFLAALTVAIIALPQSMAYALIAGIDPKYGLYAATVPVIVASLFGSSRYLIAGPTNALAMMTASVMSSVFIGGVVANSLPEAERIGIIFLLAFLAGLIQIAFGAAKFGSLINFISHSVVIAFTAGAGVLIAANQLKNFFGLDFPAAHDFFHTLFETVRHLPGSDPRALAIGLYTLILVIVLKRFARRLPGPLLAVVTSGFFVWLFGWEGSVKLIGAIPRTLPPLSAWPLDPSVWRTMLSPALAIAILGIVEAMSIAKSLANARGEKINGNQEIIAQGLANVAASFTSGFSGTGSFTRSAVNFQAGARTRLAGVFSGLIVVGAILVAAPLARFIPLSSLSAILILIAYGMIDKKAIKMAWKATSSDRIVIAITFGATLLLELEKAVYVGVILSIMLFLRKTSHPIVNKMVPIERGQRLKIYEDGMARCSQIMIFQIDGAFFFGAVREIEEKLTSLAHESGNVIVMRLKGVRLLDATGAHALASFVGKCREKGIRLIITNVKPSVAIVMKRIGLDKQIGEENITEDTTAAIKLAIAKYIDLEKCAACSRAIFLECPPRKD